MATDAGNILYVRIDSIKPNPYQPRKHFKAEALEELCESIKQYGVIQPISIRKVDTGSRPGASIGMGVGSFAGYELVAGERRLRAAVMAGLSRIPAIVVNLDENDSAIIALIENLQREDLNYLEEAEGFINLLTEHGLTQEELAMRIGKSQSTVANKIRLLKLPPLVKKILMDNNLTERHARAVLKLSDEQLQLKVLKLVCERGYNVKKTEELIEQVITKYGKDNSKKAEQKVTRAIKDIRIFVNTIKDALNMIRKSGINAKASQSDKGQYVEFVIRIPKRMDQTNQTNQTKRMDQAKRMG
jgi:ParB family chromosome partitioning protein